MAPARVSLKHPKGKKPITMEKRVYELLRAGILRCLHAKKRASFGVIVSSTRQDLKKKKKRFEGSLPWYMEWVKLDLEARRIIERVPRTSPQQYRLRV